MLVEPIIHFIRYRMKNNEHREKGKHYVGLIWQHGGTSVQSKNVNYLAAESIVFQELCTIAKTQLM